MGFRNLERLQSTSINVVLCLLDHEFRYNVNHTDTCYHCCSKNQHFSSHRSSSSSSFSYRQRQQPQWSSNPDALVQWKRLASSDHLSKLVTMMGTIVDNEGTDYQSLTKFKKSKFQDDWHFVALFLKQPNVQRMTFPKFLRGPLESEMKTDAKNLRDNIRKQFW